MYKSSSRHLGWMGIAHNHIANNRTIEDDPFARRSTFIAKLKDRCRMKAIVSSFDGVKLLVHFGHADILGEALLPTKLLDFRVDESVVVELIEKGCRNGKLYLITKYIRKIGVVPTHICKRCNTSFNTFEDLKNHLDYTCKYQRCRFCGELYQSNGETAHETGRCKFTATASQINHMKKKSKK